MIARTVPVRRFVRSGAGWMEAPETARQYVLIVEHADWLTSIARGTLAEIERIYHSMTPSVVGLRIEAA